MYGSVVEFGPSRSITFNILPGELLVVQPEERLQLRPRLDGHHEHEESPACGIYYIGGLVMNSEYARAGVELNPKHDISDCWPPNPELECRLEARRQQLRIAASP